MTEEKQAIEFGPNGAVLNSASISEELSEKYRNPSEHWSDTFLLKPQTWPPSALAMALAGAFLMGMSFAAEDRSTLPFWLHPGSVILIVVASWWRMIWFKYFGGRSRN